MAADDIINNHSRLNHVKVNNGIRIATVSSISRWREVVELKKSITADYKEIQEEFDERNIPKKGTIEDWINSIEIMSAVTFRKVKRSYEEDGIRLTLLRFIKFKNQPINHF